MSVTSLSGLAESHLSSELSRGGGDQLKKLAQEFESLFLTQLLSVMREGVGGDGFFEGSTGSDIYNSMMDQALARSLSQKGGIGLAEPLYNYLNNLDQNNVPSPEAPESPAAGQKEISRTLMDQLSQYRVTSQVGWRKDLFSGNQRFHKGIDFAAPEGSSVPAASAGRVLFSGEQGGFGNTVVIENERGFRVRYAHLNRLEVETGQEVEKGQIIGAVGSTGRSTGAHLHVEVERHGRMYNPLLSRYTEKL
jgi:murein DD-endopeptidase MepM/ murein hydrolase activator NlpD